MKIPKKGRKGFTLIELLIVVAILGVLAAIVIPNVGRFIGSGESEASSSEYTNIQSAVHSMMTDLGVPQFATDNLCGTSNITYNMQVFPAYPYVLYNNQVLGHTVNYVATNQTKGTYSCDIYGTVTQQTTGYE